MEPARLRIWAVAAGVAMAATPAIAVLASREGVASRPPAASLSAVLERLPSERADVAPPPAEPEFRAESGDVITVGRIRAFLERKRSPLAPYALDIVAAGARYGVDPRVVVAIAGVETNYGARAYRYNAWGWARRNVRWGSWEEAIDRYTGALASGYRSLRTGRFHRASRSYCPPCGDRWGRLTSAIFRAI